MTADQWVQIMLALIAGLPVTLAVILTARAQHTKAVVLEEKVDEVHKLANDRLTKALDQIAALQLMVERQRVTAQTKEAKP